MKKIAILIAIIVCGFCGIVVLEAAIHAGQPCIDGKVGNYPCQNVDLLAHVTLAELGGGDGADIWGWTDNETGKEYALVSRSIGTTFVDVTNPTEPVVIGRLPTQTTTRVQRDVKVLGDYAVIVSEATGHGMQVFDLTRLRGVTETVIFSTDFHYTDTTQTHNIVTNEANPTYAVLVGNSSGNHCNGGLHIVTMTQPLSPTFAGCFGIDGYTHDAQCITYDGPDSDYTGRELCFAANVDTLTIVDITNPISPTQISRTGYLGSRYTHQGWLTEDRRFFLLNDESDELFAGHNTRTYVMDVTDLDMPVFHMQYDFATTSADHNLYIKGNHAYLANYNSGLRILDLTGIADRNLYETGFFDFHLGDDDVFFRGAWSVYPYFASDNLIVSSRDDGLFILRANLAPLAVDLAGQSLAISHRQNVILPLVLLLFIVTCIFCIHVKWHHRILQRDFNGLIEEPVVKIGLPPPLRVQRLLHKVR